MSVERPQAHGAGSFPELRGRIALVTGAGRGLGREIALAFARQGAVVYVNDIDADTAQATVAQIAALGQPAEALVGDVSDEEVVDGAFARIADAQDGRLDVLINNAGMIAGGALEDCRPEDWDRMFAVNLRSVFLCSRAALRMADVVPGRSIVNLGSINGKVARMWNGPYSVSKAAVAALTRAFALEAAVSGIRVNTLSPGSSGGAMATAHYAAEDANERLLKGDPERFRLGVPLGRLCTPADVAAAAVFLCSDGAGHITGQELFVDGGQSMF